MIFFVYFFFFFFFLFCFLIYFFFLSLLGYFFLFYFLFKYSSLFFVFGVKEFFRELYRDPFIANEQFNTSSFYKLSVLDFLLERLVFLKVMISEVEKG